GFLVVVGRFVASAQEVLGLGSIIGKWPDMDGAAGRVHGGRIVLFVEGLLGDLQLVLGPATGPRTAPASLFVAPPFARSEDERRRATQREAEQRERHKDEEGGPFHGTTVGSGASGVKEGPFELRFSAFPPVTSTHGPRASRLACIRRSRTSSA